MTRILARELAVQTVFTMDFHKDHEELLQERLGSEFYERMASEDDIFLSPPDEAQAEYIKRVFEGVSMHYSELDGYIEKYAVGWKFGRIPRFAVAVMRVAMFEVMYMPSEVPVAAAINAAVEIVKDYEPPEIATFINGILGSFSRQELTDVPRD